MESMLCFTNQLMSNASEVCVTGCHHPFTLHIGKYTTQYFSTVCVYHGKNDVFEVICAVTPCLNCRDLLKTMIFYTVHTKSDTSESGLSLSSGIPMFL